MVGDTGCLAQLGASHGHDSCLLQGKCGSRERKWVVRVNSYTCRSHLVDQGQSADNCFELLFSTALALLRSIFPLLPTSSCADVTKLGLSQCASGRACSKVLHTYLASRLSSLIRFCSNTALRLPAMRCNHDEGTSSEAGQGARSQTIGTAHPH